jgi:hypothetical protein
MPLLQEICGSKSTITKNINMPIQLPYLLDDLSMEKIKNTHSYFCNGCLAGRENNIAEINSMFGLVTNMLAQKCSFGDINEAIKEKYSSITSLRYLCEFLIPSCIITYNFIAAVHSSDAPADIASLIDSHSAYAKTNIALNTASAEYNFCNKLGSKYVEKTGVCPGRKNKENHIENGYIDTGPVANE